MKERIWTKLGDCISQNISHAVFGFREMGAEPAKMRSSGVKMDDSVYGISKKRDGDLKGIGGVHDYKRNDQPRD
ncbi:MAG: hypothetical protein K2L86_15690 [Lachnospiraceae bacterium]|nr:hypothetical protein [Lachnospiraceae bacterium]